MGYSIRYIASDELIRAAMLQMEAWFIPPLPDDNHVLESLLDHYPEYRSMMILGERDGRIAGGALGFGSKLGIIAVRPEDRMIGLARRLRKIDAVIGDLEN